MKPSLRMLCCICLCIGLLALAADAQNPADQAKKNQEFYKIRDGASKRFCGVLLKATVSVAPKQGEADEIRIDWTMDYVGPRWPLIILEPSLEAKTFGQTTLYIYAEGKDQQIYKYYLESPSPQILAWGEGRILTVEKGKIASGKLAISARQLAQYFCSKWPKQFDEQVPVVHLQLLHHPKERGGNLDVWTGELLATVQKVPLRKW